MSYFLSRQAPASRATTGASLCGVHRRGVARRVRRRGSTLVETALCMAFVLVPMTFAGLQFGIVLTSMHAMQQIAREGGRFAAVHAGEVTFDGAETQSTPPSLRYHMKQVTSKTSIPWNDIKDSITITPVAQRVNGQAIEVSVTYPMSKKMILPVPQWDNYKMGNQTKTFGLGALSRPYVASATFVLE